jgi:hypothetical protein
MRRKIRTRKPNRHKTKLGLPDLEHVKSAVLVSLRSRSAVVRVGNRPSGTTLLTESSRPGTSRQYCTQAGSSGSQFFPGLGNHFRIADHLPTLTFYWKRYIVT